MDTLIELVEQLQLLVNTEIELVIINKVTGAGYVHTVEDDKVLGRWTTYAQGIMLIQLYIANI